MHSQLESVFCVFWQIDGTATVDVSSPVRHRLILDVWFEKGLQ